MPIYAFQCTSCGHAFDRLQRMSDPDPDACPECAAGDVKRQLTAPSFRLSGSGWYETDFKKDGEKKRNLAAAGDARPGGDKPDAAPARAEPAKKAEPKPAAEAP